MSGLFDNGGIIPSGVSLFHNSAGRIRPVSIGDKVTTVFDGEVVGIDNDLGTVTLRGNTRGAQHIDWTVEVHWATRFWTIDDEEPAS